VGRLAEVKDHRSLQLAFAEVTRRRGDCRLEILGDGPLRKELEQLTAKLGISERVRFLGAGLDVGGFLSRIDAFVLSSLSEELPMTVLEAMASSLPVISTAVGAVPELVGESGCGWLSPPGRPDELASAMLNAASAPALRQYGARARSYVEREYSTRVMASGYEELFKRVLHPSIGN
jgi:glycosyltransferase involved in cell wall biosynthesis